MKSRWLPALAILASSAALPLLAQAEAFPPTIWIQPGANAASLRTGRGVRDYVGKCRKAGFRRIVLEIDQRGTVFFPTRLAPHASEVEEWGLDPGYDLVGEVLKEAHRQGLQLYIVQPRGSPQRHPNAIVRRWRPFLTVVAADGWAELVNGTDEPRKKHDLIRYTSSRGPTTRTDPDGQEVIVREDVVTANRAAGDSPVPRDGYVLSGSGLLKPLLAEHFPVGSSVNLEDRLLIVRLDISGWEGWVMNALDPETRASAQRLFAEALRRYPVDGVVIDVVRYTGYDGDFGPTSHEAFERWLGRPVESYPEDILTWDLDSFAMIPGPLFKPWSYWRAKNVRDTMLEYKQLVHSIRPGLPFGNYVSAWYPLYQQFGSNWASERYQSSDPRLPEDYNETGYASDLDFLCVGLYSPFVTREEANLAGREPWRSVEGGAELAKDVTRGDTTVVGALFALDYKGRPEKFREAILTARRQTAGLVIFDAYYLESYRWWELVREALASPLPATS